MNKEQRKSIPRNAKKVFKGIIFEVYQWKQRLYDNSVATYERLRRYDTVLVIPVTTDGKIIVLEEEQCGRGIFVGNPGGMLEKGERPEDGARRELIEETGYNAQKLILLDTFEPSSKIEWVKYLFLAKECVRVSHPKPDPGEKIKIKLTTFEEYINLIVRGKIMDKELRLFVFEHLIDIRNIQKLKKLFM